MESRKFSIEEAFKFGWQKTKEEFIFLFSVGLIYVIVSSVLGPVSKNDDVMAGLATVVGVIFGVFIQVGIVKMVLKIVANERPAAHLFFEITPAQFFRYLGCALLYAISIIIGTVLLIIPGVIMFLRLQFGYYFVIDKDMGPVKALKASWAATRGQTWDLFLLVVVIIAINFIGALFFGLGLILTIPISYIVIGYIYRNISGTMLPQVAESHVPAVSTPATIVTTPDNGDNVEAKAGESSETQKQ